jgi:hypothetical protein
MAKPSQSIGNMEITMKKAKDSFADTMAEIRNTLAILTEAANSNFGHNDPSIINWAHVGDAAHVLELLKEIKEHINA